MPQEKKKKERGGLQLYKRGRTYHISGKNSAGTLIPRHTTEKTTWDLAFDYLKSIDTTKIWPMKDAAPVTPTDVPFTVALEKYLKHIRPKTKEVSRKLYKHSLPKYMFSFLAEMEDALTGKPAPVTNVGQLTVEHLVELQDHWLDTYKPTVTLGHRRVSNAFVQYLVTRGWLPHLHQNPWKDVPKPQSDHIATLPLDEDEKHENWNKIRASLIPFLKGELLMQNSKKLSRNGKPYVRPSNPLWHNPENFLCLLDVMYETGLRRSDAIKFDPRDLEPTELGNFSYTTVQKKSRAGKKNMVTVYLEPWLAEKVKALPALDGLGLPFYKEACDTEETYATWYVAEPLRVLGTTLGIPDVRCHRFRDSFAVNFLNAGGSLEDLKVLLGHKKVAITEFYYNPWVKSRAQAVEKRLARARAQQNPATRLTVVPPAA